jgi:hypothetical protein
MQSIKQFFIWIWPGIKWTYYITVKHWRRTIGSLFALFLAWSVVMEKLEFKTAGGALLIMWVGGYVNRRIDFSTVASAFRETPADSIDKTKSDDNVPME